MARIFVEDPDTGTQVPFLRGILMQSLQHSGLPFEDAYKVATIVRQELGDTMLITMRELRNRVLDYLKDNYNPRVALRYERQGIVPTTIQVEHPDGRTTPYSVDQHRRCMETIGLTYQESMAIATKIRQHFTNRKITETTSNHIAHITYRCLSQSKELGPAVAHRWLVWIDFLRSGRPLILLIGGTSSCGKSSIATALANQLEVARTQSTDMLREVMRMMIPERLLPVLHTSSFEARRALPPSRGGLAVDEDTLLAEGFLTQMDLLSVASEAVIERALRERVSLILEGVHIHPALVERIPQNGDAVIVPIMLAVLNKRILKERISSRGTKVPQRRSQRYLKHFDEIWKLQSFLLSEADGTKISIIVNEGRDQVVREVIRTVIRMISKDFHSTPKEVFR